MAGRKPKFKSPDEMQEKIEAYFKSCEGVLLKYDDGKPVFNKYGEPVIYGEVPLTVTGLALALGFTSRRALLDYQAKPAYKAIIETAKLRIENYAERRLYDKDGMNGARFTLQNNFKDWDADKPHDDSKGGPAVAIICDIPRTPAQASGADSQDAFSIDHNDFSIDPQTVNDMIKELERENGKAVEHDGDGGENG